MNENTIQKTISWMRKATDKQLADFLHNKLENMPVGSGRDELKSAFDKECDRRTREHYDKINGGEWL